jgi:hypothetical protein
MEGGHKKKGSKEGKFTNEGEREDGCENDAAPTNAKGKKMIRGPMTCKRCGEKAIGKLVSSAHSMGTAKKRYYFTSVAFLLHSNININHINLLHQM